MTNLPLFETEADAKIKTLEGRVAELEKALHDAIRRPMGVIPESADGLVTVSGLDRAEARRPRQEDGLNQRHSEVRPPAASR